jgi:hypothetical protein
MAISPEAKKPPWSAEWVVPYAGSEDRNVRRILNRVLIEKGANFAIFSEMTLIFLQNYWGFWFRHSQVRILAPQPALKTLNSLQKRLCSHAVFRTHLEMGFARHLEILCRFVLAAACAPRDARAACALPQVRAASSPWHNRGRPARFCVVWSKKNLTAFSCGLLMIITQEPAQSLAALDAPLSIEVTVPGK